MPLHDLLLSILALSASKNLGHRKQNTQLKAIQDKNVLAYVIENYEATDFRHSWIQGFCICQASLSHTSLHSGPYSFSVHLGFLLRRAIPIPAGLLSLSLVEREYHSPGGYNKRS